MIVVVEGPSAAGKTTWVARHCDPAIVVAEATPAERAAVPDQHEHPQAAAEFWAQLACARWERARHIEESYGVAVCDGDPFKLHYTWTLWRAGHAKLDDWTLAFRAHRRAFAAGRLGIADLILVTIPDAATLTRRREADLSRRRRNFGLHVQLAAPLAQWYHAIEHLDPARVTWSLPPEGVPGTVASRQPRTGTGLFDDVVARLPRVDRGP